MDTASMNPYVAVIAKKSRNLHKKLDKIAKAEAQKEAGKALNEEQLALLTTRKAVEKQISDVDQMKSSLEEIAAKEAAESKEKEGNDASCDKSSDEISALKSEIEDLKSRLATEESSRASLEQVVLQQKQQLLSAESSPDMSSFQELLQQKVHKLLKLFHVCARYPGEKLPADVNYFGKCLMGETSISGFHDTLQESTRKAELYLDDEVCAQFEASRGKTYLDISRLMDELAQELAGPSSQPEQPSTPVFNFFTDTPPGPQDQQAQGQDKPLEELRMPAPAGEEHLEHHQASEDSQQPVGERDGPRHREGDKKPRTKRPPRRPREGEDAPRDRDAPKDKDRERGQGRGGRGRGGRGRGRGGGRGTPKPAN